MFEQILMVSFWWTQWWDTSWNFARAEEMLLTFSEMLKPRPETQWQPKPGTHPRPGSICENSRLDFHWFTRPILRVVCCFDEITKCCSYIFEILLMIINNSFFFETLVRWKIYRWCVDMKKQLRKIGKLGYIQNEENDF